MILKKITLLLFFGVPLVHAENLIVPFNNFEPHKIIIAKYPVFTGSTVVAGQGGVNGMKHAIKENKPVLVNETAIIYYEKETGGSYQRNFDVIKMFSKSPYYLVAGKGNGEKAKMSLESKTTALMSGTGAGAEKCVQELARFIPKIEYAPYENARMAVLDLNRSGNHPSFIACIREDAYSSNSNQIDAVCATTETGTVPACSSLGLNLNLGGFVALAVPKNYSKNAKDNLIKALSN